MFTEDEFNLWMKIYCNLTIKLGNYSSVINNGVPQGSTLSPALFDIFTISLMRSLKAKGMWINLFADDLVILVDSGKSVKIAVELLKTWCLYSNMEVNRKKSAIVIFKWSKLSNAERGMC